MYFDWIYLFLFLCFLLIIGIFGGISYVIMRFCNRWTQNHKYEVLLNTIIFIVAFLLVSSLSTYIFATNVSFER